MHLLSTSVCVCLCVYVCVHLSRFSSVQLFVTPWTITHQPPLSMGVSKQEYWSGFPCTSSEDLPNPGIKPTSPCASCIGRWVLYHCATWEAEEGPSGDEINDLHKSPMLVQTPLTMKL